MILALLLLLQDPIDQLGSQDPAVRDQAQRALVEKGEPIVEDLKKALAKATDPEVVARLRSAIDEIQIWKRTVVWNTSIIETTTGSRLWALDAGEQVIASIGPRLITKGAALRARWLKTGAVAWTLPADALPSPIAAGDALVGLVGAHLKCINSDSGKTRWEIECAGSMVAATSSSIVVLDAKEARCFDVATGAKRWAVTETALVAHPCADGGALLDTKELLVRIGKDGATSWSIPRDAARRVVGPFVLLASGKGLDLDSGKERFTLEGAIRDAVATPDGRQVYVLLALKDLQIAAVDSTGKTLWQTPVGLDTDIGGECVPMTCDNERLYLARHHDMC